MHIKHIVHNIFMKLFIGLPVRVAYFSDWVIVILLWHTGGLGLTGTVIIISYPCLFFQLFNIFRQECRLTLEQKA